MAILRSAWLYRWKYAKELVLIHDQVIYKITETEFTAYDMQTFLRLDDLPGFQPAVVKVGEKAGA